MSFKVAIDGPAGAGKSTVARRVAQKLALTYLDTGAMYRAVALQSALLGTPSVDIQALAALAESLPIGFSPLGVDNSQRVYIDGTDVTDVIRTPENSALTSVIAAIPQVRKAVVQRQRSIGESDKRGVVLEGRDIGTVVFPDADVKVFLTASSQERARRRWSELTTQGHTVSYDEILKGQQERDARDMGRTASPLVPAADAVTIDTDSVTIDDVVGRIVSLCSELIGTAPA